MRTRPRSTTGALMLLIVLMLTACGQFGAASPTPTAIQPTASAPSPQPSPVAIRPGPPDTLRWSLEGITNLPTIDPAKSGDAQVNTVITMIFGGLVRLDEQQEIQPDGAEDWHISADRKVYTFTIREGLTYADGTPVTSADFAYAINRALRPETASYGAPSRLSNIVGALDVVNGDATEASGVKAPDPQTLEITLDVPAAYFLAQLSYPYTFAVPKQLVESGPGWEERAYGTGPFKVVEWKHNESILLAANERYWRGKPGFEKLLMLFSKDSESAYQRYHAGELDIMGSGQNPIPSARIAELQGRPEFKSAAVLVTRFIGFNTTRAPFDNVDVRRAFALATNKDHLANEVLAGAAVPAGRILPTGMLGTQVSIKPLAFDVAAARQALTKAGYADGAALPPVALAYAREGDNELVVQALQKMWQDALSVTVTLQPFPDAPAISAALDATYKTPTDTASLQFYLSVWGADYPDPQNFISQQFRTGVSNNNGHFSDAQFDQLVDEADQLSDRDQIELRLQLYRQAEQIAIDKVGWLPLFYPKFNILLNPRVEGLEITPNGLVAPDWSKVRLK